MNKLLKRIPAILPAFLLLLLTNNPLTSQEGSVAVASVNENYSPAVQNNATVTIKYFDKTLYYPNSATNNPIQLHISIKNNSTDTLRFKLADDRRFNLDFTVYDVRNQKLPLTQSIIMRRTTDKSIYFREISLEYGEEYSFTEDLKDYINITTPALYYIELSFYPELYKNKNAVLSSNRLTLEVRPTSTLLAEKSEEGVKGMGEVLTPIDLPPDKIIEETIIARQKSLWDQYFLYMDLEAMYQRTPSAKRKYISVSADERDSLLQTYKADLMQEKIDTDIVALPAKFEIEKVIYTKTEGTVTVTEWFSYPTFYEKKSYVYKIHKREGIWQLYDYIVTNLGTE